MSILQPLKTAFGGEDITTGKMGNAYLPSILYTKSSYPIFPVVTFQDIVWEQGQMASRHLETFGSVRLWTVLAAD